MLYQLSYEATHWERGQFIEFISLVGSEMTRYIWNKSYVNCSCRCKWRMVTGSNPIFFNCDDHYVKYIWNNSYLNVPWALKLFFTYIYNRSSHMNYFIYTSRHFPSHGRYNLNKLTSLPKCWFHSSVGRALHRYRGGQEFESSWGPDFFRLVLSSCLNWKINCDDHSSLTSTTAVYIWIISYILHFMYVVACETSRCETMFVFSFSLNWTGRKKKKRECFIMTLSGDYKFSPYFGHFSTILSQIE